MVTHPLFIRSFLRALERFRATRPLTTKERWVEARMQRTPRQRLEFDMSDPFKEFIEEMARLVVPEDDTEESRWRREAAASELGTPIGELDESDLIACADDEFLCSEALALWEMIGKARALARQA